MGWLISDSARMEISTRMANILHNYVIDDWQSKPYYQHQNFAKWGYCDIKVRVIIIMNTTGANANEWLLVLKYIIFIHNQMVVKKLGWILPLEFLSRQTQDVSLIYQMPY